MNRLPIALCILLLSTHLPAEAPATSTKFDLRVALLGDWVGALEYRDYSEPATSTKRVTLPTWLSIADAQTGAQIGASLRWHYTFDDGPAKVVEENDIVTFDPEHASYQEADNGKPPQISQVTGYDKLRAGLGTLVLSGTGTDNDKPSETRTTMTIRRNLIEILEETRPAGSTGVFAFRHAFRFVRATPPKPA